MIVHNPCLDLKEGMSKFEENFREYICEKGGGRCSTSRGRARGLTVVTSVGGERGIGNGGERGGGERGERRGERESKIAINQSIYFSLVRSEPIRTEPK